MTNRLMLVLAVGVALYPLVVSSPYSLHMAILALIAVGLASALNLIAGYAGQISFATGAFYGIGAYTAAILATKAGLEFWVTLPLAVAMTGLIGLLLGIPCLRLRGHYLAIATIGFQEGTIIVFLQWGDVTRGPMGITDIPKPSLPSIPFESLLSNYYVAFVLVAIVVLLVMRLVASGLGLQMMAVRENETAARSVGVNTTFVKLAAFTISSGMCGALGAYYAHYIGSIDPSVFGIMLSATALVMVLAGGWGTIFGPIIGAVVLTYLPEWLRVLQDYRMSLYGAILILIILFMPQGVLGVISRLSWRISRKGGAEGEMESNVA